MDGGSAPSRIMSPPGTHVQIQRVPSAAAKDELPKPLQSTLRRVHARHGHRVRIRQQGSWIHHSEKLGRFTGANLLEPPARCSERPPIPVIVAREAVDEALGEQGTRET